MSKTTNKLWTKEEDSFLFKNYPEFEGSLKDFCKLMNRPYWSVCSRVSILGIKKIKKVNRKSQYEINNEYFKEIDSYEKAYWYGFIWADGSVGDNSFGLALQCRDLYLIERFRDCISSTHKIRKHNKYKTNCFSFTNKRFVQYLNKLNVIRRKTYSNLTPIISDEYFFSFLLGLFDGDGHFKKYGGFSITSNPATANWVKDNIKRLLNVDCKIRLTQSFAIKVELDKKFEVMKVFKEMYKNIDFYLFRKFEKILKYNSKKPTFKLYINDDQEKLKHDYQEFCEFLELKSASYIGPNQHP